MNRFIKEKIGYELAEKYGVHEVDEWPGIYVWSRYGVDSEEPDKQQWHFYVGQAKNLRKRTAEHLTGYSAIDCSIKAHKNDADEQNRWSVKLFKYGKHQNLDEKEKEWIEHYSKLGKLKNQQVGGDNHAMLYGFNKKAKAKSMTVANRVEKKLVQDKNFWKELKYWEWRPDTHFTEKVPMLCMRPDCLKKDGVTICKNALVELAKIKERLGL
jgi:hypothetical protein